jgi:hypothetical protein
MNASKIEIYKRTGSRFDNPDGFRRFTRKAKNSRKEGDEKSIR